MADDPSQKQEEIEEQVLDGEMDIEGIPYSRPEAGQRSSTPTVDRFVNRVRTQQAEARAKANSDQTDVTRKVFDRQPGTIAGEPRFQDDPGWVQPGGKRD